MLKTENSEVNKKGRLIKNNIYKIKTRTRLTPYLWELKQRLIERENKEIKGQ